MFTKGQILERTGPKLFDDIIVKFESYSTNNTFISIVIDSDNLSNPIGSEYIGYPENWKVKIN